MKSIVLCADGTWNSAHADLPSKRDTSLRKLHCPLANCPQQLMYYDSGVGTDGTPLDDLSGGAMGEGLLGRAKYMNGSKKLQNELAADLLVIEHEANLVKNKFGDRTKSDACK